jgi:tryptophan synthase alpha chain
MNKIKELFSAKSSGILSVYYTAGFPGRDDTGSILLSLQAAGADLVEVGIPFSDPIADGPTIQASNKKAIDNGITVIKIFQQIKEVTDRINIPVLLMGYLNPIYQFGIPEFCREAAGAGISGLIIPDLPMQEYVDHYKTIFEKSGLLNIFLISPMTSPERVRMIDRESGGFIYMVSSSSTTGVRQGLTDDQVTYFERIRNMNLKNPVLVGFGISGHGEFRKVCRYAQGAIIGSAFIKIIGSAANLEADIRKYIYSIKEGKP